MSKRQQRVHFLEELCNCLAYCCGWDCKATPCGWVSKLLERMTETEYSKHSQTIPPLTLSHTISCVGLWHFTLETLSTRATLHGEPATHRLFKKRDSLPFPLTAASQQYVCMPCSCFLSARPTLSFTFPLSRWTHEDQRTVISWNLFKEKEELLHHSQYTCTSLVMRKYIRSIISK